MRAPLLTLLAALLLTTAAAPRAPEDAAELAWRTNPGAQLPLATSLHDSAGNAVPLRSLFGGKPIILDLGYYHCPGLCGLVRSDLFNALAASGLRPGTDYTVAALSIDPAETSADAAKAKAIDLAQSPFLRESDLHYLTGSAPAVAAISAAVGFRARPDRDTRQFLHPAGLVVLTKTGVVSGYLLGMGYGAGDIRAAVLRAGEGGIAQAALPVLLLCFHYDETTGRYTLAIEKVLRVMAVLTVVTLGGIMLALHRRGARR